MGELMACIACGAPATICLDAVLPALGWLRLRVHLCTECPSKPHGKPTNRALGRRGFNWEKGLWLRTDETSGRTSNLLDQQEADQPWNRPADVSKRRLGLPFRDQGHTDIKAR